MNTIIINFGMDVHTTNFTLCCYTLYNGAFFGETSVAPDYREVVKIHGHHPEGAEAIHRSGC